MPDYQTLFLEALSNFLGNYQNGEIKILSESDLQSHLFFECRKLMEEQHFPFPLKLFAEKGVFSKHKKIDLVLGDDEVLIELKAEPDYPGVPKPVAFSTKKEAGNSGSVEGDLEKIVEYASKGKHANFVMIDEEGKRHPLKIPGEWKSLKVGERRTFWLHKYVQPRK